MTRETKVGLLVGLAFVIVIGIYLSDHASNTNQAPPAPLAAAVSSLKTSLGDNSTDDGISVVKVPVKVTPRHPVPTNRDLNSRKPAVPVKSTDPVKMQSPADGLDALRKAAADRGEELVPADGVDDQNPAQPPVKPVVPTPAAHRYVAVAGDSLGAIARKEYGSGSAANRHAILAANPFMNGNEDMIVAGKTYVVPAIATAAAPAAESPVDPAPVPVGTAAVYTVQSGDSLWSIARNQCGNPGAVATIAELNKETLHGGTLVRVGMKLKLPKKSA